MSSASEVAQRFLLEAARARLNEAPVPAAPAHLDWGAFLSVAQHNRLLSFVADGLTPPSEVRAVVERHRQVTFQLNTLALMTARKVAPALEHAGVAMVVLKGPVAQHERYANYFVKPATDIDLLVSRSQFDAARAATARCGYTVAPPCRGIWWRVFLGEQHMRTMQGAGAEIDLHHRLQQPGCPSPRFPNEFLERARRVRIGDVAIPALWPVHACLHACMSITKALVHREPAGGYVLDVAAFLRDYGDEDLRELIAAARRLELERTLQLGVRTARLLYGVEPAGDSLISDALAFVADEDLTRMLMRPTEFAAPPSRTRLLLALCDKPWIFIREAAWKIAAEGARVLSPRLRGNRA